MSAELQLVVRSGHPDFLDLPWAEPLEEWHSERLVRMARGISRHVVRFVAYDDRVYALKETEAGAAEREYRMLLALREERLPAVEPVGVARWRAPGGGPDRATLITRYLDYALPYHYLLARRGRPGLLDRLLDGGVVLMARLHLEGFYWGDFSLSNALFRRDAGAFIAYLVDAETGELRPSLSDAMRDNDVDVAVENIAGGLIDLQASGRIEEGLDPFALAASFRERYHGLWLELTREDEVPADEQWHIHRRMERLNELGFDVEEIALVRSADGERLRIRPTLVEEGHHARALESRTGLRVQENQARRLLNDIAAYGAWLEHVEGSPVPEAAAAYRWLREIYEPAIARVPEALRSRREPPELFHEMLRHRDALSEEVGHNPGNDVAMDSYVASVLPGLPEERLLRED
ncbi:MAG: DUF4032 domain-containing protein [Thermoleophilia bacterium]|nr:DUF4032 domain-containing protein [Thermoleophilia bacterium]